MTPVRRLLKRSPRHPPERRCSPVSPSRAGVPRADLRLGDIGNDAQQTPHSSEKPGPVEVSSGQPARQFGPRHPAGVSKTVCTEVPRVGGGFQGRFDLARSGILSGWTISLRYSGPARTVLRDPCKSYFRTCAGFPRQLLRYRDSIRRFPDRPRLPRYGAAPRFPVPPDADMRCEPQRRHAMRGPPRVRGPAGSSAAGFGREHAQDAQLFAMHPERRENTRLQPGRQQSFVMLFAARAGTNNASGTSSVRKLRPVLSTV